MRFVYQESSKLNPTIKDVLKRIGTAIAEISDMLDEDYFLIDGMRHYLVLKKQELIPKNYIFIDSGYFGNFGRGVEYLRMVPNAMHPKNLEVKKGDIEAFLGDYDIKNETSYLDMFCAKPEFKNSRVALLIPPSRKYCRIEKIKAEAWVEAVTDSIIKKSFDSVHVRKKSSSRADRMVYNPIWKDLEGKRALICHSSITSIDAMLYGIPFADLGDGPVIHLSHSLENLKKSIPHSQDAVIDTFDRLLFYQCQIKDFESKLLEIMDFHQSL